MDYSYANEDKAQRRRVFIVTTAIAAIVLGIAAWAIIAIISSAETNTLNKDSQEIANVDDSNSTNHQENVVIDKAPENTPPETEGVNSDDKTEAEPPKPVQSTPEVQIAAQTEVPETGPEEILPLALVAGVGAMYVSSKKLAKRELIAE